MNLYTTDDYGADDELMEVEMFAPYPRLYTPAPRPKPCTLTKTEEYDTEAMDELLSKASNGVVCVQGRDGLQRVDLK